jgi:hypothetical protein
MFSIDSSLSLHKVQAAVVFSGCIVLHTIQAMYELTKYSHNPESILCLPYILLISIILCQKYLFQFCAANFLALLNLLKGKV